MNLSILTDKELLLALENLIGDEREITLKVLYHLIEIEQRGCFRGEGYSSLFDYCTRKLQYSEGGAYKRITASRCLRDNPELGGLFSEGRINLCTLTTASRALRDETTTVEQIVGKTKREVELLVARSSETKPRERIKPIAVKPPELPLFIQQEELQAERRYELKFSVSEELYRKLESAKAALSNSLGSELSLEALLEKLLNSRVKPKTSAQSLSSKTRYIPKAVKRAVVSRDASQCSFQAPDGSRCTERHYLQFDHIVPFSCGGKSELENLRLLCPAHNRLLAERYFGRDKIIQFKSRD